MFGYPAIPSGQDWFLDRARKLYPSFDEKGACFGLVYGAMLALAHCDKLFFRLKELLNEGRIGEAKKLLDGGLFDHVKTLFDDELYEEARELLGDDSFQDIKKLIDEQRIDEVKKRLGGGGLVVEAARLIEEGHIDEAKQLIDEARNLLGWLLRPLPEDQSEGDVDKARWRPWKNFLKRFYLMHSIPLEKFKDTITTVQDRLVKKPEDEQTRTEKDLSEKERLILEIPSLLEMVLVSQDLHWYGDYFPEGEAPKFQNSPKTYPLVSSTILDKLGLGLLEKNYLGSYSDPELKYCLDCFDQMQSSKDYPVFTVLLSQDHAILIFYFPKSSRPWLIFDPSNLPGAYYSSTEIVARQIRFRFSSFEVIEDLPKEGHCTFSMHMYVLSPWFLDFSKVVKNQLKQDPVWLDLHTPTKKRVELLKGTTRVEEWLYIATVQGHYKVAKLLLEYGANPNWMWDGFTSLYRAIQNGYIEVVKLLLENGANPDLTIENNVTPLYAAAQNGDVDIVTILLKYKVNSDIPTKDGSTSLYVAAQNNHVETVQLLLEYGAHLNTPKKDGQTPLFAATYRGHVEVVQLLLERGAHPDTPPKDGATPLFIAALKGYTDIALLLLEWDAHPQIEFCCTTAQLRDLATEKSLDVRERVETWLISRGNDEEEIVRITPREIAQMMGHEKLATILAQCSLETHLPTMIQHLEKKAQQYKGNNPKGMNELISNLEQAKVTFGAKRIESLLQMRTLLVEGSLSTSDFCKKHQFREQCDAMIEKMLNRIAKKIDLNHFKNAVIEALEKVEQQQNLFISFFNPRKELAQKKEVIAKAEACQGIMEALQGLKQQPYYAELMSMIAGQCKNFSHQKSVYFSS